MQLPEDCLAFKFEFTNSRLFQQKINARFTWQWRHCDVILVVMLLQTVIEVLY